MSKSLLLLLGAGAIGLAIALPGGAAETPALGGLVPDQWYRLTVRSSISRNVFDVDAAREQAQTLLGREGFDVRAAAGDDVDPFVYELVGIYRGKTGTLANVKGIVLLNATPTPPQSIPNTPDHIDGRPVTVTPGTTYFARASISWPLSMLVTRDAVISHLTAMGFTSIVVTFDADKLDASWPVTERGGDLFVQATYQGPAKALDVPSQIVSVWT